MGARAAANQFGYFVGSAAGGIALGLSGYPGLGIVLGALFVAAALPLTTIRIDVRGCVKLLDGVPDPRSTGGRRRRRARPARRRKAARAARRPPPERRPHGSRVRG